jgi:hypothetical protein
MVSSPLIVNGPSGFHIARRPVQPLLLNKS